MRKHLLGVSAALTLALISACGGAAGTQSTATATAAPTCVNAKAAHRAYLVVQHGDGRVVQRCVGFSDSQINGEELMKQSAVELQAQTFSFGKSVCQLDNEPAQFSECFPKDKPYWALYQATSGQPWVEAQTGYTQVNLKDGEALGWKYTPAAASPAPPPLPRR